MNPAIAAATQDYIDGNIHASKLVNATSSAPQTMFDGLQTIVNLCRVQSGYNALDPDGTGNKVYFTGFTQNVANVPCLSLLSAETKILNNKAITQMSSSTHLSMLLMVLHKATSLRLNLP